MYADIYFIQEYTLVLLPLLLQNVHIHIHIHTGLHIHIHNCSLATFDSRRSFCFTDDFTIFFCTSVCSGVASL